MMHRQQQQTAVRQAVAATAEAPAVDHPRPAALHPTTQLAGLPSHAGPGAVIQGQFWERQGNQYIWHPENPGQGFRRLPETRRYYSTLNPLNLVYGSYPVYTHEAVDHRGEIVQGGLSPAETAALQQITNAINGTPYATILNLLTARIGNQLGPAVVDQFYRGAHIVFNDQGAVFRQVFQAGVTGGIAQFRGRSASEWLFRQTVPQTPNNLAPATDRNGGMGARRPELGQTSHYTADAMPQLGIDLPAPFTGHILIGLVPHDPTNRETAGIQGDTFVQTEMYGFRTLYDKYIGHVQGFLWNATRKLQSGLVGYSNHSEKNGSDIREHDNDHQNH